MKWRGLSGTKIANAPRSCWTRLPMRASDCAAAFRLPRSGACSARIQAVIARPTRPDDAGSAGEEVVEGSHVLLAAGRRPNIGDLDLDAAGIRYDQNWIVVDYAFARPTKMSMRSVT